MNSNKNVIAYFVYDPDPIYYTLTTSVSPSGSGTVNLSPSGGTYTSGTSVTLTAAHATDYKFDHWGGDASGTGLSTTVTMNSNKNVTAYFEEAPPDQNTLTTQVSPSSSYGYVTPSSGTYDAGTSVTITAHANSGYEFDHWGGDASGTGLSTTVTMNSNKNVVAYFKGITYTLTTDVSPSGSGYIEQSPSGYSFAAGTQVTLTAYEYSGSCYEFCYWDTGTEWNYHNPYTFTMDEDKSITAVFTENDPVYRAVCIGVDSDLAAPSYDVDRMRNMLSHCSFGSSNIEFYTIQYLKNNEATYSRVWNGISGLFSDADWNDVSYVYFTGHGKMIFPNKAYILLYDSQMTVDELELLLRPIYGTKVVILDSCASGGFIGKGEAEITKENLINFNENVIDIFSMNDSRDLLTKSRYQVLTSCHYYEESFENPSPWFDDPYSYFTLALVQGCGYDYYSGIYWADNNGDRKISLQEACNYTEYWLANEASNIDPLQDAQLYPEGSDFPIVEY
jgi:hypothetical protein